MHLRYRRPALATILLLASGTAVTAEFELISRTGISAPMDSNGDSMAPVAASADGRYALFSSTANNLVTGDTNRERDLFLYDAVAAQTLRVSVGTGGAQANGDVGRIGGVSDDGRHVVFDSTAGNLGAGSGRRHVYLHDRQLNTTTALTTGSFGISGDSANPRISGDGRYVVFDSVVNFSDEDSNGTRDVYRYDRQTATFALVSITSDGRIGNADSYEPQISADGNAVAFYTWSNNLVAGDTNNYWDVLLRRMDSGSIQRVSVTATGGQYEDYPYLGRQALNANGRYVLFSVYTAGSADDTNNASDGYRFDSNNGSVMRVTLASNGSQIDGYSFGRAISADGQTVLMQSSGANVLPEPSNTYERQYLRRIGDGVVTPVTFRDGPSLSSDEFDDSLMSADAGTVFAGTRNNGVLPGDTNGLRDVYRQAVGSAAVQRLSTPLGVPLAYANNDSGEWSVGGGFGVSGDSRYVVFVSLADNLVIGDFNGLQDVFLRDRLFGTTQRISLKPGGVEADCPSRHPAISANGRYVAFASCAGLGGLEPEYYAAVYRYDLLSGGLELVSALPDGSPSDTAFAPRLSADGQVVSFWSCTAALASNGIPGDCDIYVRNLFESSTLRASPRLSAGGPAVSWSFHDISADGRYVLFNTHADNIVAGDSNSQFDAFVFDTLLQTMERASVDNQGAQLNNYALGTGLSANGNLVVFNSSATSLGGGGSDFYVGIFLRDRQAATTTLISRRGDGVPLNGINEYAQLSASGDYLTFYSTATNNPDVPAVRGYSLYYLERPLATPRRIVSFDEYERFTPAPLSADGRSLVLASGDDGLSDDDGNGHFMDVFLSSNLIDLIFRDGLQSAP